ncbi:unnamed protein product [Mesocestoides corti]|uniref:Uncharacterized protein n=1 Tax=Mesocestoides corti TaxID=53468 RepID=A0A0R3U8F9_MESCO|nr:unnamed protein product [Mesocestoides corti]
MPDSNPRYPSSTALPPSDDEVEEVHIKGCDLQAPGSSSGTHGRRSSAKLGSVIPPVLIYGWLLSFSHYIALYSMLVARLGTRCDCRKLRAKSEVVRRRSVNYARKCQDSLLPIITKMGMVLRSIPDNLPLQNSDLSHLSQRGSRKSNLEDYYRLFFLHCTCLEFFIGQLLRTAQLFQCFSLNIGRSLTSSLVAPPQTFIYSGLAEVERPRKKRSQILSQLHRDERNTYANDSLSGIELEVASRISYGQTPSAEQENHSSEHPCVANYPSGISQQDPRTSNKALNTKGKLRRCILSRKFATLTTASSGSLEKSSGKQWNEGKKKLDPPILLACGEHKKRIIESDTECFEKLAEDIRLVKCMITEIHANVSVNPWAVRPGCRRNRRQSDVDCDCYDDDVHSELVDDENDSWPQEDGDFDSWKYTPKISHNHSTQPQFRYQNSTFQRWQRQLRNARLTRAMRKNVPPGGFEEKSQEDDETVLSKRLRRNQYICLSLIIVFSIGLFGSALGSCIYLLT